MCKKGPRRRIAQVKMPRLQTCTISIFPSPSHFGSDFNIDTKQQKQKNVFFCPMHKSLFKTPLHLHISFLTNTLKKRSQWRRGGHLFINSASSTPYTFDTLVTGMVMTGPTTMQVGTFFSVYLCNFLVFFLRASARKIALGSAHQNQEAVASPLYPTLLADSPAYTLLYHTTDCISKHCTA